MSENLLEILTNPYRGILKDFETDDERDRVIAFVKSEGIVVFSLSINDGLLYLSIIENRDHNGRKDRNKWDLVEESWVLAKPGSIKSYHDRFKKFIKDFYGTIIQDLNDRAGDYTSSLEGISDTSAFESMQGGQDERSSGVFTL